MGAPTAKKKAPKKTAVRAVVDGQEFTEEDIARLEAQVEEDLRSMPEGPIGPDGEIRPVVVGKAGKVGIERTHIFTLEGEEYYVPKTPSPAIMLRFMREVRDKSKGRDVAVENAMMSMLGKKSLDALCDSPDTSDDDVANVFIIVGHILFTAIKKWRERVDPALDPS